MYVIQALFLIFQTLAMLDALKWMFQNLSCCIDGFHTFVDTWL